MEREKKKSNHNGLKVRKGEGTQSWVISSNLKKSSNYRGKFRRSLVCLAPSKTKKIRKKQGKNSKIRKKRGKGRK